MSNSLNILKSVTNLDMQQWRAEMGPSIWYIFPPKRSLGWKQELLIWWLHHLDIYVVDLTDMIPRMNNSIQNNKVQLLLFNFQTALM